MPADVPPAPPALQAPAPEAPKAPLTTPTPARSATPSKGELSPKDGNVLDAALVQQAGTLGAAQTTADATKTAAETAARNSLISAILAFIGGISSSVIAWRVGRGQRLTTQRIKHAEFRQQWIDKLREEMANFASLTEGDGSPGNPAGSFRLRVTAITLRMNRKDEDFKPLLLAMEAVVKAKRNGNQSETDEALAEYVKGKRCLAAALWANGFAG